jgi:hypothetical protein
MKNTASIGAIFLVPLLLAHAALGADWAADGIPLCAAESNQLEPIMVSDESGGAIIAWRSFPGDADIPNIFAQRVSAGGRALWGGDGVAVCAAGYDRTLCDMIPDGAGGAIVIWEYDRTGGWDIYAQKVDSTGEIQWDSIGVAICTAPNTQCGARLVSDAAGGAIVVWEDLRDGAGSRIYAQRVSAEGHVRWTPNGVPVRAAGGGQFTADLVADGEGGAIVVWQEARAGARDIYAQRLDASGAALWEPDGIPISAAGSARRYPEMVADGVGGAIVMWKDGRAGADDLYAQRVNAAGEVQWASEGVAISTSGSVVKRAGIAPDGFGGAVIAWPDGRAGDCDIYAQRVSASGAPIWEPDGLPVCTAARAQEFPRIAPDGFGGAIVAWQDARAGAADIYAQRVSAVGGTQGAPNGAPLCTAAREQFFPEIVPDGDGGAIVAWQDFRGGADYDIYAESTELLSARPGALDFGIVRCGGYRDRTIIVQNAGCDIIPLEIGEGNEDFHIVSNGLVPALGPGDRIAVIVRFNPTRTGAHKFEISLGEAGEPVSCSGIGVVREARAAHAESARMPAAPRSVQARSIK